MKVKTNELLQIHELLLHDNGRWGELVELYDCEDK